MPALRATFVRGGEKGVPTEGEPSLPQQVLTRGQRMPQPQMPQTRNWRFEIDFEGLGWLTIDTPDSAVNTLSREAIAELEVLVFRFEDLIASGDLLGVILLSGKDSGFIAGADVTEFDAMADF